MNLESMIFRKKIATMMQDSSSVFMYFLKQKDLRGEFEALVTAPGCDYDKSKDFVLFL